MNQLTFTTLVAGLVLSSALADEPDATAVANQSLTADEIGAPLSPPTGWTGGYVIANGIRIHYWRTGGDKPPMLLTHGSSDDGLCWTNLAKELEADYDIILADARGHGLSDPNSPSDPADAQAEDLAAIIRELKLVKPVVMGHSMGSAAAMWFAAKYPDVPGAVILEDPRQISRPSNAPGRANDPAAVEKRRAQILRKNNTPYAELVADCFERNPQWGLSECQYWAPSKRLHHPNTAYRRIGDHPQASELFPKITAPTLILKADASGEERTKNEEVAGLLPRGSIVHITGAKHNVRRDQKELVVEAIDAFLAKDQYSFRMENLIPWSIAAFDSKQRAPAQRVEMVARLGFRQLAFGGKPEQQSTMKDEWRMAKQRGIQISSVWLYLNPKKDLPGKLKPESEALFQSLNDEGLKTQIWVGFSPKYFEGLGDAGALQKAKAMTEYLCSRAEAIGCKIALYNHGGWLGEPENQVKVIASLPGHKIGIIYNFHHAHLQLDRYPNFLDQIMPYLWCVNLNGMKKDGEKIITIGEGDLEQSMIDALLTKGFQGPFGVLGHVRTEDAELVLQRNVKGLHKLFPDVPR